jgi:low molecular weight protein-tyrosine phosphatase
MRILTVCLGNICRSPTAEAALRRAIAAAGLDDEVTVESAGTGDWHIGHPPDPRMTVAARKAGLELTGAARLVTIDDFAEFDLILAMDRANLAALRGMAPTVEAQERVRLFRSFEEGADGDEVPDPWGGAAEGFDRVVEISAAAAGGVVAWILAGVRR